MGKNCAFLDHSACVISDFVLAIKHLVKFWQVHAIQYALLQVVNLSRQTQQHGVVVHADHFAEQCRLEVFNWLPLTHFFQAFMQVDRMVAGHLFVSRF